MESNREQRGFVRGANKRQVKKRTSAKIPKEEEAGKMANASIPFIEGLSPEGRRTAQAADDS